jgi:hypothetical protein
VVDNAADDANLVWFAHPSGGVSIRSAFLPALADVQPQINPANGVVPQRGSQGDTIVINGSGFGAGRNLVEVIIGVALTASTSVVITVQPDYDADVLSDDREATLGSTRGGDASVESSISQIVWSWVNNAR